MSDVHRPTGAAAIEVVALQKRYGDKEVLAGVDFVVPRGTIFALLGPNGAGKTTIVNILSTLVPADGGSARVAGLDVVRDAQAVRAAIGVTGQFSAVDGLLTGRRTSASWAISPTSVPPPRAGGPASSSSASA